MTRMLNKAYLEGNENDYILKSVHYDENICNNNFGNFLSNFKKAYEL